MAHFFEIVFLHHYMDITIPFITAVDRVYKKIRNLNYKYLPNQLTLFPTETQQYDPWAIRELLNNCVAHQDYKIGKRIYVDEFEDYLVITNAGTFLPGDIRPVLEPAYSPPYYRNQVLTMAMVKFGMIETASSGIRKVYLGLQSKLFPLPDYDLSYYSTVKVTIYGRVIDDKYASILFNNPNLDIDTVFLLDRVQKKLPISDIEVNRLRKLKLIEGRKPKFYLSDTLAESLNQKAQYIKNKGLNDKYYKELILNYLEKWTKGRKSDFIKLLSDKLPDVLSSRQKEDKIRNLLQSLKREGRIMVDSKNHQTSYWILVKS